MKVISGLQSQRRNFAAGDFAAADGDLNHQPVLEEVTFGGSPRAVT